MSDRYVAVERPTLERIERQVLSTQEATELVTYIRNLERLFHAERKRAVEAETRLMRALDALGRGR